MTAQIWVGTEQGPRGGARADSGEVCANNSLCWRLSEFCPTVMVYQWRCTVKANLRGVWNALTTLSLFTVCVLFVPSVLWYSWLGLLTCKNRLPYNFILCWRGRKTLLNPIQSVFSVHFQPLHQSLYVSMHVCTVFWNELVTWADILKTSYGNLRKIS